VPRGAVSLLPRPALHPGISATSKASAARLRRTGVGECRARARTNRRDGEATTRHRRKDDARCDATRIVTTNEACPPPA